MQWIEYVGQVAKGDSQAAIGAKAGVDSSTVFRWGKGLAPKPETVVAFARAYSRPVLEAFVAAGFLTAEDAGERPVGRPDISQFDLDELLAEIRKKFVELAGHRKLEEYRRGHYGLAAREGDENIGQDQIEHEP